LVLLELILLNYNIPIMKKVFLGLGSNLGDRAKNLDEAKIRIETSIGKIVAASSVYQTEPWGFKSENDFLNMAICVETNLNPSGLLGRILMIESEMGRIRCEDQLSSREIDIDILLYDNEIVNEAALIIPHPRMHERKFVLVPLCEIGSEVVHPVMNQTIESLLKSCTDSSKVIRYPQSYSSLSQK
jgi:2-amino-4-hydroxy-6-hydroxymethyldihydropteridine diphosphokinase